MRATLALLAAGAAALPPPKMRYPLTPADIMNGVVSASSVPSSPIAVQPGRVTSSGGEGDADGGGDGDADGGGDGDAGGLGQQDNSCGFNRDCPRDYDLSAILDAPDARLAEQRQADAANASRAGCTGDGTRILDDGGWCLAPNDAVAERRGEPLTSDSADVAYNVALNHIRPASSLLSALSRILSSGNGSLALNDMGAGVGQLGHALKAVHPELDYQGYDGAGNVEAFTSGYVRFRDLSLPAAIPPKAWAVCSEVGEHIPHRLEAQFVANLHHANCRGLVLTWAVLGQIVRAARARQAIFSPGPLIVPSLGSAGSRPRQQPRERVPDPALRRARLPAARRVHGLAAPARPRSVVA
jgi:hypothetical protein